MCHFFLIHWTLPESFTENFLFSSSLCSNTTRIFLSIHYIVWFVGQLSSSPHLLAEWLYNACGMSLWNRHGDGGGGLTGERESLRQSWEEDESIGGKTKKDRGDPRRKEEGVDAAMGGMTGTEDECILVYPLDTWPTCHGFIFAHYQATKMIPLSEES